MNYKISIVVSIYNVEHYLDKCIQSLCNQTYKNIEIILVVRNSGDRCIEICETYQSEDNRIILVHQTEKGIVNARKMGTLFATGDYIIHIDGDDWVESDWLERAAKYLKDYNPDMLYLSGCIEERKEKKVYKKDISEGLFTGRDIYNEIFQMFDPKECFSGGELRWNVWSWIVKRDLLRQQQMLIDDAVWLWEDAVYVFLCLIKARSVALVCTGNYHYVIHENSSMHMSIGIKEGNLELAYKILKENFQKCMNDGIQFDFMHLLIIRTAQVIFRWEYKFFWPQFKDYLFPYSKVRAGSRVIVYGAGQFGRQVVGVLLDLNNYSLVGWCDQDINKEPLKGKTVQNINSVLKVEYDYIIVAVFRRETALVIRDNLMRLRVPDDKIALMDAKVITEDKFPW